jgi:hypothetical protein
MGFWLSLKRAAGAIGGRKRKAVPGLQSMAPDEYFRGDEAWEPIDSSNVHSIAFYGQGANGIMRVRFRAAPFSPTVKSEYEYLAVPVEVYQGILSGGPQGCGPIGHSHSKGGKFYHEARMRYVYRRIS